MLFLDWLYLNTCNKLLVTNIVTLKLHCSPDLISYRVELPIIEHIPITKHFPKCSSFFNQIEQYLC